MSRGRRTAIVLGAVAAVLALLARWPCAWAWARATGWPRTPDRRRPLAFGQIRGEPPKLRAWVEFGELVARPAVQRVARARGAARNAPTRRPTARPSRSTSS